MITTDSPRTTDLVELVERVIEVNGSRWAVIFADILAPALLDYEGEINGGAQAIIAGYVKRVPPGKVARARLVIADFHVLALVLPDTRTCRLYTPGVAQEAFLLKLSTDAQLRQHVDAAGKHPSALTTIEEVTATYHLVDLASPTLSISGHDRAAWADAIRRQVHTLISLMNTYTPPPVERVQDWFLSLIAQDDLLLRQVLRFVAVLPSLRFDRSRREVVRALRDNVRLLRCPQMAQPPCQRMRSRLLMVGAQAVALAARILPPRVVGAVVDRAVGLMAARFIVPDSPTEVTARLEELDHLERDASLDQLGELVFTREEADRYADAVTRLIDLAATHYGSSADRSLVNDAGFLARRCR